MYVVDNRRSLREGLKALTSHFGPRTYVNIPVYLIGPRGGGRRHLAKSPRGRLRCSNGPEKCRLAALIDSDSHVQDTGSLTARGIYCKLQHIAAQCIYSGAFVEMSSTQRISVNLSPEEHRQLAALAEKARVSKAWLGRRAITELLDRYREREFQLPLDPLVEDGRQPET